MASLKSEWEALMMDRKRRDIVLQNIEDIITSINDIKKNIDDAKKDNDYVKVGRLVGQLLNEMTALENAPRKGGRKRRTTRRRK